MKDFPSELATIYGRTVLPREKGLVGATAHLLAYSIPSALLSIGCRGATILGVGIGPCAGHNRLSGMPLTIEVLERTMQMRTISEMLPDQGPRGSIVTPNAPKPNMPTRRPDQPVRNAEAWIHSAFERANELAARHERSEKWRRRAPLSAGLPSS